MQYAVCNTQYAVNPITAFPHPVENPSCAPIPPAILVRTEGIFLPSGLQSFPLFFPGVISMAKLSPRLLNALLSLCLILAFAAFSPLSARAQENTDTGADINALSAIVVEYPSGRILYTKNEHQRMPPASLTKIMTAILALEYGSPDDVV